MSVKEETRRPRREESSGKVKCLAIAFPRPFHESVAGKQHVAVERLKERRPAVSNVGPPDQPQDRIVRRLLLALVGKPRHRRTGFGDHPHTTMHHRIAHEAFARQGAIGG